MSDELFWKIIDETKADNQETQTRQLKTRLKELSKAQLIEFEAVYRETLSIAYNWDLWAAADIINGGCSDDGFDYFCDWLISRGQNVFESALENPETLVGKATPWDTEFEEFRYIMIDVMEEVHNGEFPRPKAPRPAEPNGVVWDEDTVEEKYPALAEWINSSVETVAPPTPQIAPSKPPSFWQSLFGKK